MTARANVRGGGEVDGGGRGLQQGGADVERVGRARRTPPPTKRAGGGFDSDAGGGREFQTGAEATRGAGQDGAACGRPRLCATARRRFKI
jgi:hypothetical protein